MFCGTLKRIYTIFEAPLYKPNLLKVTGNPNRFLQHPSVPSDPGWESLGSKSVSINSLGSTWTLQHPWRHWDLLILQRTTKKTIYFLIKCLSSILAITWRFSDLKGFHSCFGETWQQNNFITFSRISLFHEHLIPKILFHDKAEQHGSLAY